MNHVVLAGILLAARDKMFRNMGSGFRDKEANFNPLETFSWIALLVVAVIVVGLVVRFIARRYDAELYNSPRGLFGGLCRTHKLNRAQRRLLQQVARAQHLSLAAKLFLEPDRLETASTTSQFAAQRAELQSLRRTLFAGMESETTATRPLTSVTTAETTAKGAPLIAPIDVSMPVDAPGPLIQ